MDKFIIKCPECGEKFSLTTTKGGYYNYFKEMHPLGYSGHIMLRCPNCGYSETDKKEKKLTEQSSMYSIEERLGDCRGGN
jgi:uncharacterized Zn finger protein